MGLQLKKWNLQLENRQSREPHGWKLGVVWRGHGPWGLCAEIVPLPTCTSVSAESLKRPSKMALTWATHEERATLAML